MSADRKMLFAMTHFDDDPDRAAISVMLACLISFLLHANHTTQRGE